MKKKLLLIGGGGHCKSCIDVIEAESKFEIKGIIDVKEKLGQMILGYSIIGTDSESDKFLQITNNVLITVGQIKTPKLRIHLYNQLKNLNANFSTITSPSAYVSPHSRIGEGTIVMHGAIINAGANIGCNCIINSNALIEHDVIVDSNCHISTGAIVNGDAHIHCNTFIGSQAMIREGVNIGENSIIQGGAVVLKDIAENSLLKSSICQDNKK